MLRRMRTSSCESGCCREDSDSAQPEQARRLEGPERPVPRRSPEPLRLSPRRLTPALAIGKNEREHFRPTWVFAIALKPDVGSALALAAAAMSVCAHGSQRWGLEMA